MTDDTDDVWMMDDAPDDGRAGRVGRATDDARADRGSRIARVCVHRSGRTDGRASSGDDGRRGERIGHVVDP